MTNSMSPEEIAEMSEDCQCSCKELEQLRADISEAYYLRDKAEGRYCTALGAIEQLHAAVKTAQELAARRLMEIDRLKKREKDLMDVIDSRDRALGFVPLDEVHASEPSEQLPAQLAWGLESKLPGENWKVYWALYSDRDRAEQAAKNGRPEGTEWRVVTYARMPERASRAINSIDDVAAICHSVTGLCCHILGSPGGPCTIGNCAAVRGYLGGPEFAQGASRDASPADLVGALQDVVHTDPGPVRAGRAAREWHFDRYRSGKLMAQGVKVHAPNYADAYEKAVTMLFTDGNKPTDELRLSEKSGEGQ